jgi:hypothetical protein
MNVTRNDPRYVSRDDPAAVLHAWGGPDGTMDMGGWTDTDRAAFLSAVQDEARFGAGAPLSRVSIHDVERDADGAVVCCRH